MRELLIKRENCESFLSKSVAPFFSVNSFQFHFFTFLALTKSISGHVVKTGALLTGFQNCSSIYQEVICLACDTSECNVIKTHFFVNDAKNAKTCSYAHPPDGLK